MLEDCLFTSRSSVRSKKPATLTVSVLVHGALAGALILIPLFQNQVLPQIPLFEPLHPPLAPRNSVELVPVSRPSSAAASVIPEPHALVAPIAIPTTILKVVDSASSANPGFLPNSGGFGNGLFPGFSTNEFGMPGIGATPPPPPPTPPAAPPRTPAPEPTPTGPVRRISELVQSNLIYTVKPTYPRLAAVSRTQGTVILEAVITRDGRIDAARLRVLTGNPLLTPAAVEAVQQWRYRPTVLNGEAVEVVTTITVNFSLN